MSEEKTLQLNDRQLRQLDKLDYEIETAKKSFELSAKDIEIVKLKIQILNAELREKEMNIKLRDQLLSKCIKNKQEYLLEVAKEFNITDRWGYDPQSGEVKITINQKEVKS